MPKKKAEQVVSDDNSINNVEEIIQPEQPKVQTAPPEFISFYDSKLPKWLMNTGNVGILNKFLNFHKDDLSEKEQKYLQKKINTANIFNMFEKAVILDSEVTQIKDNEAPELPEQKLKTKGNVVKLTNIHQNHFQKSRSGCWSHSYDMMLQSRGIHLSPEEIRDYRPENSKADAEKVNNDTFRKFNMDIGRDPYTSADLLMKICPNTAMCEVTFNGPEIGLNKIVNGREVKMTPEDNEKYLKSYKKDLVANMKQKIIEAIEEDRCPVGIVYGGHYRTITGINKKTGELYMKDSVSVPKFDGSRTKPDEEFKESLNSIVDQYIFNPSLLKPNATPGGISITWLKDLPVKDKKLGNCISYDEDGKVVFENNDVTGTMMTSEDTAVKNGILRGKEVKLNTLWDQSKNKIKVRGYLSTDMQQVAMAYESYRVPDKIYPKGKKIEPHVQTDDYTPHSYDLLLGTFEKYDTITHEKLGSNYGIVPKMSEQEALLALGDRTSREFDKYIEDTNRKISQGGNKNEIDALKADLLFVQQKKEQFTNVRNTVEENLPYARLQIMYKTEKENRTQGRLTTVDDYKDSVYRSIALAGLSKRYQILSSDKFDEKQQKKNALRDALKPENFAKEIEDIKNSMGPFRPIFDQKIAIAFSANAPLYVEENVIWKPANNATLAKDINDGLLNVNSKKQTKKAGKENHNFDMALKADEMTMEALATKYASKLLGEMIKLKDNKAKPGEKLIKGTKDVREDFAERLKANEKVKEAMENFNKFKNIAESIGYGKCFASNILSANKIVNDFAKAELPDKVVGKWKKDNATAIKQQKKNSPVKA